MTGRSIETRRAYVATLDPLTVRFRDAGDPVPVQRVAAYLPTLAIGDEVRIEIDGRTLHLVQRVGNVGTQQTPTTNTPGGVVSNSYVGDVADGGTEDGYSRADHRHGRESFGAVVPQLQPGLGASSGTAETPARSDHTHGTPGPYARSVDLVTVGASSTAEETLLTTTITGGTITAGGMLRLLVAGEIDIAADAAATIRVELDGTTLAELAVPTLGVGSHPFRLTAAFGAPTSSGQSCVADLAVHGQTALVDHATGSVAWGSDADLTVTVQFDVADAGNVVDRRLYLLEQT